MNITSAPCDLHIHSIYSDGALAPLEIVRRGKEAGLAALSIADHDTIAGQAEASEAGKRLSIEVISGIELTVTEGSEEIHILGYLFDPEGASIRECSESRERSRRERAGRIVEKLEAGGVSIAMEEIEEISGKGTIGRLHIARLLRDKGHTGSIQEGFDRYIGKGRPAFVKRQVLALDDAVAAIRGSGGVAVWAHPGPAIRRKRLVERIVAAGISGLESEHPNHTPELGRLVAAAAAEYGLVCTGGSDFHFTEVMKADIGGVSVPYEAVTALRSIAGGG